MDGQEPKEPALERADVTATLNALFDIRNELRRIRALLEEEYGEQGDEEEDS